MHATNEGVGITLMLDACECPTVYEAVVAIAESDEVDFLDLMNDGYPVCLGNSYAQYEFTAIMGGDVREFAYGPIEHDELCTNGTVTLYPAPMYELLPAVGLEAIAA